MSLLPNMETDITLLSLQRTVVIDAKYYKETLVGKQGNSKRIRSGHLYQMYAYLHHTTTRYPDRQIDGMLIYPTVGQQISADYEIGAHRLKLLTIDLMAPWPEIHDKLLAALSRDAAPFSAVV
ncbi:MAG: 5-methylcytosine restriction system specificity protein McrC [Hyphomonadaceae bacterium]|jgi:5-methylcytosine-specific restriction enzyme subunit McrC